MMAAWRQGQGDYFHEQGPYPQQLEHEQVAHVVASVGEVIGPVAFSSLTATREWLQRSEATRFVRAYRKAREWVNTAPAAEIAEAEREFFPQVDPRALTATIAFYQRLGNWNPLVTISRATYEAALDVFLHSQVWGVPGDRHPSRNSSRRVRLGLFVAGTDRVMSSRGEGVCQR